MALLACAQERRRCDWHLMNDMMDYVLLESGFDCRPEIVDTMQYG